MDWRLKVRRTFISKFSANKLQQRCKSNSLQNENTCSWSPTFVDLLSVDKMSKCWSLPMGSRTLLCREIRQSTKLVLPPLMQSLQTCKHHILQDWSILKIQWCCQTYHEGGFPHSSVTWVSWYHGSLYSTLKIVTAHSVITIFFDRYIRLPHCTSS